MNLNDGEGNEQIVLPGWYNPYYIRYRLVGEIDFFKVYDDFNQTKIKLFTLEICKQGWYFTICKSRKKISHLYKIYDDRNSCGQKLIDTAILKLEEEIKVYEERKAETAAAIKETNTKFLSLLKEFKNEYNSKMGLSEPLSANEKKKKMRVVRHHNPSCKPFNDPYNEFGWKSVYDLRIQLLTEYKKRIDDYKSGEEFQRSHRQFFNETSEDSFSSYFRMMDAQNVVSELILERDYKINEALLGVCKKYFKEDLSQPIYDGLAYFLH